MHLQLVVLNLGGNRLSHMPDCLAKMSGLQTLHLFGNSIESLDDRILSKQLAKLCSNKMVLVTARGSVLSTTPQFEQQPSGGLVKINNTVRAFIKTKHSQLYPATAYRLFNS